MKAAAMTRQIAQETNPDVEQRREVALLLALLGALVLFIVAQFAFSNVFYFGAALGLLWFGITRLTHALHLHVTVALLLGGSTLLMLFAGPRLPLAYGVAAYSTLLAGYLLPGRHLLAQLVAVAAALLAYRVVTADAQAGSGLVALAMLAGALLGHLLRQPQRRMAQEHSVFSAYNRQIMQQMPAGLLLLDYASTITKINRSAAAMLGVTEETALNRTLAEMPAGAVLLPLVESVFREMGASEREVELPAAAGSRLIQVRANLARDPISGGAAVIMLLEDRSALKRLERELQRSAQLAAVGQLAASVAHEINNPVGGIIGYVRTCLEEGGATADDLKVILQGVEKIPPAVKKLLDLTRDSEHKPGRVPVAPLVRDLVRLHARQTTVHNTIADDIHCHADPTALAQALTNVLLNALAAAGAGGTVTCAATMTAQETVITITDSGPGIPPDALPRIFDPFYTTRRDTGGTGLGLAMVARIMERHGGRVQATAQPGATSFALHFPAAPAGKE